MIISPKTIWIASVLLSILAFPSGQVSGQNQESYELSPESRRQPGVPTGELIGPKELKSKIFPGTERKYWLYVPAQYTPEKAACVMVVQDGRNRAVGWKLPTVMDNLIHQGEMPVTIGVFVSPGVVPAPNAESQPRFNRSFEYDGLGDRYARFLLEELLPEVSKSYNLSENPNDRAIAGSSSGGICAFTVAWQRPDAFRRVLSTIGTFVGLRGGNEYPILIRKHEPQPIRIFLQDGSNDNNLYAGSWWLSNQSMLSAFEFSGYDVAHRWGTGGHNARHATAIMPDALRWLWRDYPKPVQAGRAPQRRTDILMEGADWELVSRGHQFTEGPAVNSDGEVFFSDIPAGKIYHINSSGEVKLFKDNCSGVNGLMFDRQGQLFACVNGDRQIVRFDVEGNRHSVVSDVSSNDLFLTGNGGYFTDPANRQVWHFTLDGQKTVVDTGIAFPNGIIGSTDHSLLQVSDSRGRFTFSFQIQPDGTLKFKQPYGHLHLLDSPTDSGADGMTVDVEGRTYVTSRVGVQVMDQLGRCHLILRKPDAAPITNVVFEFDWLNSTGCT